MKTFKEMWESATDLGADLKSLAEEYYNLSVKTNIPEDKIQAVINIFAQVNGLIDYLEDTFAEKSEQNKLRTLLKNHSHLLDKVVLPME